MPPRKAAAAPVVDPATPSVDPAASVAPTPPVSPVVDPVLPLATEEDPFSTAFAEFATEPEDIRPQPPAPTPTPSPTPTPAPGGDTVADSGLPDPEAVAAAAQAARDAPVAPVDPAAPAAPAPVAPVPVAPTDDALLDRFRGIVKEGVKEAIQPEPERPAPVAPYTPEEAAVLTAYDKDYPDVRRAEELIRRREYQEIATYIFDEVSRPLVALAEQVQSLAGSAHEEAVFSSIPDYDEAAPKVVEWARSKDQPAYLRQAYEAVITRGTPADVIDLFDRWRAATNIPAPTAAVPAAPAPAAPARTIAAPAAPAPAAPKPPAIDEATRRAAAALAPTGARRSGLSIDGLVDPDDFAGAFETFAKQGS